MKLYKCPVCPEGVMIRPDTATCSGPCSLEYRTWSSAMKVTRRKQLAGGDLSIEKVQELITKVRDNPDPDIEAEPPGKMPDFLKHLLEDIDDKNGK